MNILIDQINYHVEVSGEGPPLLLLHGFTGDLTTWTPFLETWEKFFRLIRVDIIGHGKTKAPPDVQLFQMDQVACQMVKLLDALSLQKVFLLGYSMGGRLALTITERYSDRIQGLILESSSPGIEQESARHERMIKDAVLSQSILKEGIPAFVEKWGKIPLFESQKKLPLSVQQKLKEQRLQNNSEGLAYSLIGMGTGSQRALWGDLAHIPTPILLIVGSKDVKFRQIADKMIRQLPEAEMKVVSEAGHAVHLEQPESFAHIVTDYILKWKGRWI